MLHADTRLEPGAKCKQHAASCDRVKRARTLQRLVGSSNGMPKPARVLLRVQQRELVPRAPLAGFCGSSSGAAATPTARGTEGGGGCNVRALTAHRAPASRKNKAASPRIVGQRNNWAPQREDMLRATGIRRGKGGLGLTCRLHGTATSSCWLLAFLHCSCLGLALLHGQVCSVNAHVLNTQ